MDSGLRRRDEWTPYLCRYIRTKWGKVGCSCSVWHVSGEEKIWGIGFHSCRFHLLPTLLTSILSTNISARHTETKGRWFIPTRLYQGDNYNVRLEKQGGRKNLISGVNHGVEITGKAVQTSTPILSRRDKRPRPNHFFNLSIINKGGLLRPPSRGYAGRQKG